MLTVLRETLMTMTMPPAIAIADLLTALVGRNVTAHTVKGAAPSIGKQAVAFYIDDFAALKVVGCCDVALGASLGAALAVIPAAVVTESIMYRRIDPTLASKLHEVFDAMASVFAQCGSPRLMLRGVENGVVSNDTKAVIATAARRLDLDVAVAGYASGRMSILIF